MPNLWENIIINERVYDALRKIYERNAYPPALIFFGPEGVGKEAHAFAFAQSIHCKSNSFLPCGECYNCLTTNNFLKPFVYYIFPTPSPTQSTSSKNIVKSIDKLIEKKKLILT